MTTSLNLPVTRWQGKTVLVLGFGQSGQSAARLLLDLGAEVTIVEEQSTPELVSISEAFSRRGATVVFGGALPATKEVPDLLVVSPGVSTDHAFVRQLMHRKVPVIGELELASWFIQDPIIAVTGTNGKSTTVRLIGDMLQQSGKHIFVGGNLGVPLCEAIERPIKTSREKAYDYLVVEVSSFQLETIHHFHPWIAVLLNITPDHLDRHKTEEKYISAKRRIFERQTSSDWSLVNADDPLVQSCVASTGGSRMTFSRHHPVESGVFVVDHEVRAKVGGREYHVLDEGQVPLRGSHNVENVLAAIGVSLLCGCSQERMVEALQRYSPIEHVLEPVREWRGITFINDSKGTNVDATVKAIQSFQEPLVVILGGQGKGGDFSQLTPYLQKQARGVIVMGEASQAIAQSLGGSVSLRLAETLDAAVKEAVRIAEAGDVVLFSPSCASFDMFRNYRHRGMEFKRIVAELP